MLSCIGFPECRAVQYFPGFVTDAVPHDSMCSKVEGERGGLISWICKIQNTQLKIMYLISKSISMVEYV
jgi:hypothetical protein